MPLAAHKIDDQSLPGADLEAGPAKAIFADGVTPSSFPLPRSSTPYALVPLDSQKKFG
jgi:hypothetical protein